MKTEIINWIDEVVLELEDIVSRNEMLKSAEMLQDFRLAFASEVKKPEVCFVARDLGQQTSKERWSQTDLLSKKMH